MKGKFIRLALLVALIIIVSGCAIKTNSDSPESTPQNLKTEQEIILHPEDIIATDFEHYFFNGFIGEDTLSFETSKGYHSIRNYQPVIKGHKFRLKDIESYSFEIIDFNRGEGFVKLKATPIK